ncbi:MAG: hypothetical protein AB1634_12195 [Thermodesulfobacteriota bacterium]
MKTSRRAKKSGMVFPNRKISETFLDFSSPLLGMLDGVAAKGEIEKVLIITYTVWNAVVMDEVNNTDYVARLRASTKHDLLVSALIEQFIARKKELFPDDLRMVGEYSVTLDGREWRLHADARDPSSIR